MNTQTVKIANRKFEINEVTEQYASISKSAKARGFDGTVWFGVSARTGRQRSDLNSIIVRSATTGDYVILASAV
jgi:hypothetical protein